MIKQKVYLETTLFNYYFLEDAKREHEKEITMCLFNEIKEGKLQSSVSDVTIDELNNCYEQLRSKMLRLIKDFKIEELKRHKTHIELREKLTDAYIGLGVIPRKKRPDAVHIASATLHKVDFLVSWNCKHIVRPEVQKKINAVNILKGYEEIELRTPLEVIHYGD